MANLARKDDGQMGLLTISRQMAYLFLSSLNDIRLPYCNGESTRFVLIGLIRKKFCFCFKMDINLIIGLSNLTGKGWEGR